MVQTDRGKQDMDAIRDQVAAMEHEEIDLRAKRLAEMADAYGRAIGSGIISSLLGIGLTGVIGFLIFRAEAARRREDWLQGGALGSPRPCSAISRPSSLGTTFWDTCANIWTPTRAPFS